MDGVAARQKVSLIQRVRSKQHLDNLAILAVFFAPSLAFIAALLLLRARLVAILVLVRFARTT